VVLTRAALLVALGGCNVTFDLDEPIAILPGSSWSQADVQTLHRAVSCWQKQFGVPYTFDADAANQHIEVGYSDLTCLGNDGGQFMPPAQIDVCPIELLQPRAYPTLDSSAARDDILFIVLVHELGHAAGILRHAADPDAVMSHAGSLTFLASIQVNTFTTRDAFTDADRAMFVDANGEYTPTCASDPLALRNVYYDGEEHIEPVECFCPTACPPPDELEPNDWSYRRVSERRAYDLTLCDDERDLLQIDISARVRIESSSCGLTMRYQSGGFTGPVTYGLVDVMATNGDMIELEHPQIGVCEYRLVVE
jgi:hypothetical protein